MSLMQHVIYTPTPSPPKVIVYGSPGVGKTTFAASAGALLIDCEGGAGNVRSLARTPYLQSWQEMRQWLAEISAEPPQGLKALAIDTIDWMIQRIIEHVVLELDPKARNTETGEVDVTNTIGSSHGGFYNARDIVTNVVYRDLLPMLNRIADNGAPVILLGHAANTQMTAPEGYDLRLAAPDLPKWIAPTFIEWADAVLYASNDRGDRRLRTTSTNVILAKNRFDLPEEIELSWPAFVHWAYAAQQGEAKQPPAPENKAAPAAQETDTAQESAQTQEAVSNG